MVMLQDGNAVVAVVVVRLGTGDVVGRIMVLVVATHDPVVLLGRVQVRLYRHGCPSGLRTIIHRYEGYLGKRMGEGRETV